MRDLPLATKLKSVLNCGTIHKVKNKNAYVYVIGDLIGLIKTVLLINGNMRTQKINQLYNLTLTAQGLWGRRVA